MSTRWDSCSRTGPSGWRRLGMVFAGAILAVGALAAPSAGTLPVDVTVLENAPDAIVLQYQVPDFVRASVDLNGTPYTLVTLNHEPQMTAVGAPDLPHVTRSVIIPETGGATVTVDDQGSSFYELTGIDLVPSKGVLLRTIDPESVPYAFDEAVYKTDAFFPGQLATLHEPYIMRDYRGVVVDVFPFQYNPVSRTLRVYTTLTVRVVPEQPGQTAAPRSGPARELSRAFDQLYKTHFVNYAPPPRYAPLDEVGNMLIICNDAWIPNVTPLANHKNAIGIATTVVGVSTIGNNATAIKNYIQNVYNTSNLAFVLLVGDSAQIATPTASGGSSDPTYSKLAGSDNYPEIMVGRFSAETAAQVDTQVLKSVEYEELPATIQPWFWKGVGIASALGAGQGDEGQADYVHIDEIRGWLLGAGYTLVDQIYDTTGGTAAMVTAAVNAGRGVISYCGHGAADSWVSTGFNIANVNALTNDNMLPFIFSVACVNGQFAGGTCFAEAWLRATHNGEPTGAVAMYASSINQSWAPPMEAEDEFNLLLTDPAEPYHTIGALYYAGSCSMMDAYAADGVAMFDTWHVFGDPSLRVIGRPTGLSVTPDAELYAEGQPGGPFTPNSIVYTVANLGSTAVDYQVTKLASWLTITNASGTILGQSSVHVTLSIGASANSLGKGRYTDTVSFVNTTSHEGDDTRGVTLRVGIPAPVYTWPLDSDPGWTRQGQWAFGQPTGQGGGAWGHPDPTAGATGTNVFGVNLHGNYSLQLGGPYYVTLGPVDLTDVTEVSLKFQRWLNSDFQPWVSATIEASSNGTSWTTVWSNGGNEFADAAWTPQTLDVSAVADDQPAVYIRWGYRVHRADAVAYSGWNIDDVQIWGLDATPSQPGCTGDANCDGAINWRDIDYFVAAMGNNIAAWEAMFYPDGATCPFANNDVNGDGTVNWRDIDSLVATMNVTCP